MIFFPCNVENVLLSASRKYFLASPCWSQFRHCCLCMLEPLDKGRLTQAVRLTAQAATDSRQLKTASTVWSRCAKGWFTCMRGGKFLHTTQHKAQSQLVHGLFLEFSMYYFKPWSAIMKLQKLSDEGVPASLVHSLCHLNPDLGQQWLSCGELVERPLFPAQ